jgi:hypothetical protein
MSLRTILIVMADGELQQLLVDFCAVLAIATVTADCVVCVQAILHRQTVTEVILDGLQGEWPSLVGLVRQEAGLLPITLWATDGPARRQAERLGVRFVDQNSFALPALVNVRANPED